MRLTRGQSSQGLKAGPPDLEPYEKHNQTSVGSNVLREGFGGGEDFLPLEIPNTLQVSAWPRTEFPGPNQEAWGG